MRHLSGLLGLALIVAGSSASAQPPTVVVRAETRIELRVERREDRVLVHGVLRDDLANPLGGKSVAVRIAPEEGGGSITSLDVRTDRLGRFGAEAEITEGSYQLYATFDGDEHYERVAVERPLDLDLSEVRLRVTVPDGGQLDLDLPTHAFTVTVESDAGVAGVGVDLRDELERLLDSGRTDAHGVAEFIVSSAVLGSPGAGRVKARSHSDALRSEAQTEVPIVRFRASVLTLATSLTEVESGQPFQLSGTLSDSQRPLPGLAVGLFDDEVHLGTVLTGADGAFLSEAALERETESDAMIVARFESNGPGRASTVSQPIAIRVRPLGRTSFAWLFAPILLTALALALVARRAPARDAGVRAPPPKEPAGVRAAARVVRRAERFDVSGRVVDRHRDEPIPSARVALAKEGDDRNAIEASIDADGRFHVVVAEASVGTWRLRATAPGYVAQSAEIVVPHRGEWSGLEVRLESLRDRAVEPYRAVAAEVLPSSRLWAVLTNREVLVRAREKAPNAPGIEDLTARVEIASYSAEDPTEHDVADIERASARTIDAIRSTRSPPTGAASD